MTNSAVLDMPMPITTGQAPVAGGGNAPGQIVDGGNLRQEPEALRQAAARMRDAKPESDSVRNLRIAEAQRAVLDGETRVGPIHHVVVRNLEGGPGGVAAFAAKQGEMLRFLATVEELLNKAPREQAVAKLDSQKAQLEMAIKAGIKLKELILNQRRDAKPEVTSAPPLGVTSGAGPITTQDFRADPDVMRSARNLFQQQLTGLGALPETTGTDPYSAFRKHIGPQQPSADTSPKSSSFKSMWDTIERYGAGGGEIISNLLNVQLTQLKELKAILDTEGTVNSQLRSLEGVLGQGKFGLEMERLRTDGQQMQGFNNYIAETARWNFITDLNMTFGMQLGALGLNFSPFSAGALPMDLLQAAISGRGDLWVRSEGVTDPRTGEPLWYIKKGGNLREMLLQQYAKGGVMDQRIMAMYDRLLNQFQPNIDAFYGRKEISLFPEGALGGYFQSLVKSMEENASDLAAAAGVIDLDPIKDGFGHSLLQTPKLANGIKVKDPKTGKLELDFKSYDAKQNLNGLSNDPLNPPKAL